MSCSYYVFCVPCQERTDPGINYGKAQMQAIIRHQAAIASLAPLMTDLQGDAGLVIGTSWGQSVDPSWFAVHAGHELSVIDEYGRMEKQCVAVLDCKHCGRRGHCTGSVGHDGEHDVIPRAGYRP